MESFLKLASQRYSVRSYSPKTIEEDKIQKILAVANIAPTAANLQPVKIYILENQKAASFGEIRNIFNAPMAFVICYDDKVSWKNHRNNGKDGGEIDAAIVTTHMMLEAADLGLGTCWIGSFNPEEISRFLNLDSNIHPVAILPLGYPAEDSEPSTKHTDKKSIEEICKYVR